MIDNPYKAKSDAIDNLNELAWDTANMMDKFSLSEPRLAPKLRAALHRMAEELKHACLEYEEAERQWDASVPAPTVVHAGQQSPLSTPTPVPVLAQAIIAQRWQPTGKRCNRCHRSMVGTTAYDGACACGGLID